MNSGSEVMHSNEFDQFKERSPSHFYESKQQNSSVSRKINNYSNLEDESFPQYPHISGSRSLPQEIVRENNACYLLNKGRKCIVKTTSTKSKEHSCNKECPLDYDLRFQNFLDISECNQLVEESIPNELLYSHLSETAKYDLNQEFSNTELLEDISCPNEFHDTSDCFQIENKFSLECSCKQPLNISTPKVAFSSQAFSNTAAQCLNKFFYQNVEYKQLVEESMPEEILLSYFQLHPTNSQLEEIFNTQQLEAISIPIELTAMSNGLQIENESFPKLSRELPSTQYLNKSLPQISDYEQLEEESVPDEVLRLYFQPDTINSHMEEVTNTELLEDNISYFKELDNISDYLQLVNESFEKLLYELSIINYIPEGTIANEAVSITAQALNKSLPHISEHKKLIEESFPKVELSNSVTDCTSVFFRGEDRSNKNLNFKNDSVNTSSLVKSPFSEIWGLVDKSTGFYSQLMDESFPEEFVPHEVSPIDSKCNLISPSSRKGLPHVSLTDKISDIPFPDKNFLETSAIFRKILREEFNNLQLKDISSIFSSESLLSEYKSIHCVCGKEASASTNIKQLIDRVINTEQLDNVSFPEEILLETLNCSSKKLIEILKSEYLPQFSSELYNLSHLIKSILKGEFSSDFPNDNLVQARNEVIGTSYFIPSSLHPTSEFTKKALAEILDQIGQQHDILCLEEIFSLIFPSLKKILHTISDHIQLIEKSCA